MSTEKLVASGSAEYWERRCHEAWASSDGDGYRIHELREALNKAARFLESAANYQDRPGAMAQHGALAAELREVLVPPGVKALRETPAEPAPPEQNVSRAAAPAHLASSPEQGDFNYAAEEAGS